MCSLIQSHHPIHRQQQQAAAMVRVTEDGLVLTLDSDDEDVSLLFVSHRSGLIELIGLLVLG